MIRFTSVFAAIALGAILCQPAFGQAPATNNTDGSEQLPGTPDPSTVPVRDDSVATAADALLNMVLSARQGAGEAAIEDVQIAVYDMPSGDLVSHGKTDEYGFVTLQVPFTGAYRLETCNPKFLSTGASVNDCGSDGEPTLMCVQGFDFFTYDDARPANSADHILKAEFYLDTLAVGEVIDLDNILYDLDKATLRPESKRELDELVRTLAQLPGLDIELRSHTDSRASDSYNQDLSQRRAQSVVDYLIAEGIGEERFTAQGFGESRLLNECADGVECTEEQHQINRRTEFAVTGYEPVPCPELPALTEVGR